MPHDNAGHLLKEGDRVMVPAVVKSISHTEDYCNVLLETVHPCHPGDYKTTISLNAKQVVLDAPRET